MPISREQPIPSGMHFAQFYFGSQAAKACATSTPFDIDPLTRSPAMDPVLIVLVILVLLAAGGWGYGSYYPGPGGAGPSPLVNMLGLLALILLVTFIVLLATG